MEARELGRWFVTSASVVLPLAAVIYSLQYQSIVWSLVGLAVAAAIAVVLAEVGARIEIDPAPQAPEPRGAGDARVVPLRRRP